MKAKREGIKRSSVSQAISTVAGHLELQNTLPLFYFKILQPPSTSPPPIPFFLGGGGVLPIPRPLVYLETTVLHDQKFWKCNFANRWIIIILLRLIFVKEKYVQLS